MKDKERTKRQIIDAIGTVMADEGYEKLGVNRVARTAGYSKELIYRYFQGMDGAVTEFFTENDYWLNALADVNTSRLEGPAAGGRLCDVVVAVLQNQMLDYFEEPVLRELIAQSVDRKPSRLKRQFAEAREAVGEQVLRLTDQCLAVRDIPFRGIAAIFVAGTYYAALHANRNRGRMCKLDLNAPATQEQLLKAIEHTMKKLFMN
ncbi:TetR/AcrR family transcriptional regulator [Parapedobacter soli]|uniref:TetR/AcrR family transcriptional regulator n=1 Tax=Parapedobacter soli TaxID=416955 RepID=UPI0021C911C9|nr:TetR/AcrR family transcriptional regulator [Parapedobacter soli]